MKIMNLSSLRRTFFILFSVMGLFLVLSCFISTEDYFMKQARIVKNGYDRTTHSLITAARTTQNSLRRTTERRDDRVNIDNSIKSGRSTPDPTIATKRYLRLTTAQKSPAVLPNGITNRDVTTSAKGNPNKTEVQDSRPVAGRVIRHLKPARIGRVTYEKDTKIGAGTEDVGKNQNESGLFIPHQPAENVAMETAENKDDDVMMKPVEPWEKPAVHKNTFLSVKYKNTDMIQQFKQMLDVKKGAPKDTEYYEEKKSGNAAKLYSLIKKRNLQKQDKDHRQYFEALSQRKMRFARGFREINRSVLRKVQWQPHYDDHNYNYLMTPDTNCYDYNGEYMDLTLVVFVLTSPTHYSNRRVIRRTWMAHAKRERLDMKIIFLLGATDDVVVQHYISDEAERYKDILQEDFHDSYVNLTLKTIMGLKWSTQSCPKAKFVMKVDDDVAVNVVDLLAYLKTLKPAEDFIGGIVTKGAAPYRNANKKWYVPEDVYPNPTYPPYPQGKSYIMTMNVARELFRTSKKLEIFPWEDVFVGLCLQKIGMQPSEIKGFDGGQSMFGAKGVLWKSEESLKILQGLLIVFDLNDDQMETIWHVWRYNTWPTVSTKQRRLLK